MKPTWQQRVNPAGNWTGYAHLFAGSANRAVCGTMRMDGEEWRPAPEPLIFAACEKCKERAGHEHRTPDPA